MPPLPEAIILVFAPFAPLFSDWVWYHAQLLLMGAMLTSGAHVTAASRVMGFTRERYFTDRAPLVSCPVRYYNCHRSGEASAITSHAHGHGQCAPSHGPTPAQGPARRHASALPTR
jgi:hypothetical protein